MVFNMSNARSVSLFANGPIDSFGRSFCSPKL